MMMVVVAKTYLMCLVHVKNCVHCNQSNDIGTIRYINQELGQVNLSKIIQLVNCRMGILTDMILNSCSYHQVTHNW